MGFAAPRGCLPMLRCGPVERKDMSLVTAAPELITVAATDLANIGSTISAAHLVAATPTVAVIPAAADEVSSGIAHLFSQHAQEYQALAGQAAAFHEQFVQQLTSSAGSYAGAEAANAGLLQPLAASAASVAAAATPGATSMSTIINDLLTVAIAAVVVPVVGVALSPIIACAAVAAGLALLVFALAAGLSAVGGLF
jgi:hypothetical protein